MPMETFCTLRQTRNLNKMQRGGLLGIFTKVTQPTKKYYREDFKASDGTKLHNHVVQSGDSILRQTSAQVNPIDIPNTQIQTIISCLKETLERHDGLGMSACQIGIPVQISVVQVTPDQLKAWTPEEIKARDLQPVPLRVLINPEIKVTDKTVQTFREGCCSLHGMTAHVPRFSEVSVSYLDEKGEPVKNWKVRGWTARIIQHEIDHINGRLFTDIMKNKTLAFSFWEAINSSGGKFKLSFNGKSAWKHKLQRVF